MFVGHVGYPQTRANNFHFVGHVDHLFWGDPHDPQLGEKWGAKKRGLGSLWVMWAIYPSILNRWLTTFAHVNLYKIQSLVMYPFYITPITHNQAGQGFAVHEHYPQQYPQTTLQLPPKQPVHQQTKKTQKTLYNLWTFQLKSGQQ